MDRDDKPAIEAHGLHGLQRYSRGRMHALRTTAAARGHARPAPDVMALLKRHSLLHYRGGRGGRRKQRAISVIGGVNGHTAASDQLTSRRVRNTRHRLIESRVRRCERSRDRCLVTLPTDNAPGPCAQPRQTAPSELTNTPPAIYIINANSIANRML